jgi:predicted AAA+ superfamily ATPase
MENVIFGSIKRMGLNPDFWHTYSGGEVDFVVKHNQETLAIEVKASKMKENRLPKSLNNFIAKYHPQKAYIVNKNYSGEQQVGDTKVYWLPAYVFASWNKLTIKS